MSDVPNDQSAYVLLQQIDVGEGGSTVKLDAYGAKPGPPPQVHWQVPSYGDSSDRPADLFCGLDVTIACKLAALVHAPAIVSRALHERLRELAAMTFDVTLILLIGPDGMPADYFTLRPRTRLAARAAAEAKPGDLQWGPVAFAAGDAPAELFTLALGGELFLVANRRLAEQLPPGAFAGVDVTSLHRSPVSGGARAAIDALQRLRESPAAAPASPPHDGGHRPAIRAATEPATPTAMALESAAVAKAAKPAKARPVKAAKPAIAKPAKAKPAKARQSKAKSKAKPARAKPARAKPAKAKPAKAKPARPKAKRK